MCGVFFPQISWMASCPCQPSIFGIPIKMSKLEIRSLVGWLLHYKVCCLHAKIWWVVYKIGCWKTFGVEQFNKGMRWSQFWQICWQPTSAEFTFCQFCHHGRMHFELLAAHTQRGHNSHPLHLPRGKAAPLGAFPPSAIWRNGRWGSTGRDYWPPFWPYTTPHLIHFPHHKTEI